MQKLIVSNQESLEGLVRQLHAAMGEHAQLVTFAPLNGKRGLPSNALSHIWYAYAEECKGDEFEDDIKCFCKLNYGVPILRKEDQEFNRFYNMALFNKTYEQKIESMKFVPITSRMTKDQMNRYMTRMQVEFANMGIILTSTGEFEEYQAKKERT